MNKLLITLRFVLGTCLIMLAANALSAEPKQLVIYGATGKVGSHIMLEALARGHRITAVTRDLKHIQDRFKIDGPVANNFTAVQSDVTDLNAVTNTIAGADVVVVAVGYSGSPDNDPAKTVQHLAAKNLITAARTLGDSAPRIIQFAGTSTLRIGDSYLRDLVPVREDTQPGTKAHANSYGHLLALGLYQAASDLDWTVFSPNLTGGNKRGVRTGQFQTSLAIIEAEIDPSKEFKEFDYLRPLSWEDFGVAIVNEIENPQYIRQQFTAYY